MDKNKEARGKPVEIAALERALKAMGPDRLAARLNAPPELIQTWINGHATMPGRKFLVLVDIIDEIGEGGAGQKESAIW
jgi:hypothetical protein